MTAGSLRVGPGEGRRIWLMRVAFVVVAVNAPGVTVVCRKPAARDPNPFSAPLSARFEELSITPAKSLTGAVSSGISV